MEAEVGKKCPENGERKGEERHTPSEFFLAIGYLHFK
jgi:hypothetical protein